jgi:HlyD family secretion protein
MPRPPEDHALVGCALAGMGGLVALWALFWPIPTEVVGKGVLIYPDQAGLLDSRAAGQVRRL